MKVMMISLEKGWSVEELIGVIRTKLNEPKKFNALMILPSKKAFEDEDIRFFDNDTKLCLFIDSNKKKVIKSSVHENTVQGTLSKDEQKSTAAALPNEQQIPAELTAQVLCNDDPPPPPPVDLELTSDMLKLQVNGSTTATMDPTIDIYSPICNDENISTALRQDRDAMLAAPLYAKVLQGRNTLPMLKAQEAFLSGLQESVSKTLIVVGDTG